MRHNLRPNTHKRANFYAEISLIKSEHADSKPGCDNTRYYAIQITASQFYTDKPRDASASAARVVVANLQLYYV